MVASAAPVMVDNAVDPFMESESHFEISIPEKSTSEGKTEVQFMKGRPEMVMKKWHGQATMSVRYEGVNASGTRPFLSNKVEWGQGNEKVRGYQIDEDTYEFEVVLASKPATNKFDFIVEGMDDFDFFYQPPLTQEEIDSGLHRPENIVGSYAVYHKTKSGHRLGSINYATGKAFHIYRPKAIDANGAEEWAELKYQNGVLSVTVPQSFLDSAVYPVVVDPTFGYTSCGGSSAAIAQDASDNALRRGRGFASSASDSVNSIWACLDAALGSETVDVSVFVNTEDTAADSHNQVAEVERLNVHVTTIKSFYVFSAAGESFGVDDYVLNAVGDGADLTRPTNTVRVTYDTGASGNVYEEVVASGYTTLRDEDPWTEDDASGTLVYSIYVSTDSSPLYFYDSFTESADTLLASHTPDFGDSWTQVFNSEGDDYLEVLAANDTLTPENDGLDASAGAGYSADFTYTSANYQVEYTCTDCGQQDDYVYSFLRGNATLGVGYALWDTTDTNSDDAVISEITSTSSCTQIDIVDEGDLLITFGSDGETIRFQVYGNEIVAFKDRTGYLYGTNSNVTDTNKAGIGMGALPCETTGDFQTGSQEVDNFNVFVLGDTETGWNSPTTTGEVSNQWTSPTNAYSSNDSDASEDTIGEQQDYGDFGFSLASDDTVTGIQVKVEAESDSSTRWGEVGVEVSNDNGSTWSSQVVGRFEQHSDDKVVFGHARDLWGLAWTPSDLNDTDFRIRLTLSDEEVSGANINVDHVEVKVYSNAATAGAEPPPQQGLIISWINEFLKKF